MAYPAAVCERAMKLQEMMLRGLSGNIHWFRCGPRFWGWIRGVCGATRSPVVPRCSARTTRTGGLWTRPRLWTAARNSGRPQAPTGSIEIKRKADRSRLNNRKDDGWSMLVARPSG